MRISHFTALLLACVLLFLPTVGLAVPSFAFRRRCRG